MRAAKTINRRAQLIDWTDPLAPVECPKVPHETRADAQRHLDRLPSRAREARLNVYRCHICRAWHVGHAGERIR